MKKNIGFLIISLLVLISCSTNEASNPAPVTATPTEVKAVLDTNGIIVTWKAIDGSGVTYN